MQRSYLHNRKTSGRFSYTEATFQVQFLRGFDKCESSSLYIVVRENIRTID